MAMSHPRGRSHNSPLQSLPSPSNPLVSPPGLIMMLNEWVDTTAPSITQWNEQGLPSIHIWEECFEDIYIAPVTDVEIKDSASSGDEHDHETETKAEDWEVLAQPFWVSTRTHVEVYTRPMGDACGVVLESRSWEEGRDFCDRPFWVNLSTFRETRIRPHGEGVSIKPFQLAGRLTARATAEMEERFKARRCRAVLN